jgi:hypothetical protein
MATTDDEQKAARKLVEGIAESHGYVGEEVLGQLSPAIRQKIEQAMRRKDEMSASSIITYVFYLLYLQYLLLILCR